MPPSKCSTVTSTGTIDFCHPIPGQIINIVDKDAANQETSLDGIYAPFAPGWLEGLSETSCPNDGYELLVTDQTKSSTHFIVTNLSPSEWVYGVNKRYTSWTCLDKDFLAANSKSTTKPEVTITLSPADDKNRENCPNGRANKECMAIIEVCGEDSLFSHSPEEFTVNKTGKKPKVQCPTK